MELSLFKNSRLNKLGIDFPILIAPMVGLSHVAFRELIRSYLPAGVKVLQFSEMLSSRRLPSEKLQTSAELQCADNESFWLPQLLANEERFIEPSISKLMELSPWGFDINMGCPVKHTLRHNWGVRLMGDIDYAANVVKIAKRHSPLPVSVKLRALGTKDEDISKLIEFTQGLQAAGADWLSIHARSPEQKHQGKADWWIVKKIRENLDIPVVVNGGIQTFEDIAYLESEGGVDGIMLARGAIVRPWLVSQYLCKQGYMHDEEFIPPFEPLAEGAEFLKALLRFINILDKYSSDQVYKLERLRFYVATASRWYLFGHSLWRHLTKIKNYDECYDFIVNYAKNHDFPILTINPNLEN